MEFPNALPTLIERSSAMADVVSSVKVNGRSMPNAIVAPTPGKAPTMTPITVPTRMKNQIAGLSRSERPPTSGARKSIILVLGR